MAEERIVYDGGGNLPPPSPGTKCTAAEGKTVQSERDSSDINLTIKKYNLQPLQLQPGWSGRVGEFGDMTQIPTYTEALNALALGREAWSHVPPEVRVLFDNEMSKMLDAWDQGTHREIFEKIGWLEKPANELDPAEVPGSTA